jgi:uncharacterized protein (TIGR03435 family)
MISRLARCIFAICAFVSLGRAQQPSGATAPAFEVVSVKPWASREVNGMYTYPGGRIECHGCTLQYLTLNAFNIQAFQLSGGPGWTDNERYEIVAEPPASSKSSQSRPPYSKAPPNEEQRQMLQSLLMDRFQLRYSRETKEGPVYLLLKGRGELKMKDSEDKSAYPWSGSLRGGMITGDGLKGINESMPDLALRLSRYLERPVLDQTGLSGSFDFLVPYPSDDARPDVISMILTTVTALGLKLETSRGTVENIVIEHAEKPSSN